MTKGNQFYGLYQYLDKEIKRELIEDFVVKSLKSLKDEGLDKEKSLNKIKSYFAQLHNEITDVCVDLMFRDDEIKTEKADRLIKVDEIAKTLKITKAQVYNLINDGKIKSTKIGERGTRIYEKDFEDFIKSRKIK
jgi:excisionase family DNA binding protein